MKRAQLKVALSAALLAGIFLLLAVLPQVLDAGMLRLLGEIMLAIALAQLWNLMAGYAGLFSLGHQLFVGVGAYAMFLTVGRTEVSPWLALPVAAAAGAVLAALLAPALFRLREAHFSIGIWVFAEIAYLLVSKSATLGGVAGLALSLSAIEDIEWFQVQAFWLACVIGLGTVVGVSVLMRSRLGLALLTVRDNEVAARSIGVDVWRVRLPALVLSGAGCALVGAAYFTGASLVSPDAAFDINWVVMMMFATLIGGLGTIEGPILGVLVWYLLRELLTTWLGLRGGWYLMAMGGVAMAISMVAPRGLWGLASEHFGWRGWSVQRRLAESV